MEAGERYRSEAALDSCRVMIRFVKEAPSPAVAGEQEPGEGWLLQCLCIQEQIEILSCGHGIADMKLDGLS